MPCWDCVVEVGGERAEEFTVCAPELGEAQDRARVRAARDFLPEGGEGQTIEVHLTPSGPVGESFRRTILEGMRDGRAIDYSTDRSYHDSRIGMWIDDDVDGPKFGWRSLEDMIADGLIAGDPESSTLVPTAAGLDWLRQVEEGRDVARD